MEVEEREVGRGGEKENIFFYFFCLCVCVCVFASFACLFLLFGPCRYAIRTHTHTQMKALRVTPDVCRSLLETPLTGFGRNQPAAAAEKIKLRGEHVPHTTPPRWFMRSQWGGEEDARKREKRKREDRVNSIAVASKHSLFPFLALPGLPLFPLRPFPAGVRALTLGGH
ncbi:hypothetical protein Tc00.1047053510661.80 [Trypanosoma cruzi]|uniref:Uncharacterized protein n=1 Tax=Trypanosoma cruzi (strain CL Brener) TaxID=353153 RepID=Q4DUI4_TRYCC|nr:hypothetical protein Tc00.1047053510661.80 [Trypanosoma cruzi]EAN96170.1 hypothetical protein Tc00.1047053510661.80 [Trypanosoma cruzi]|eukprot:XP_818021.1 hypothetical protein [Trypanosoma cruzi strain CL Brener]